VGFNSESNLALLICVFGILAVIMNEKISQILSPLSLGISMDFAVVLQAQSNK